MKHRPLLGIVFAGLCLVLAACSPSDPLKRKVSATSETDFDMWKSEASYDLSSDQWRDFNESVRELKVGIEIGHEASGSAAVEAAMLEKVNNKTVGDVILSGLQQELKRLSNERAQVQEHIRENADFHTNPGDTESADRLAFLRGQQAEQLARLNNEVDRVVGLIRTYAGPNWKPGA